MNIIQSFWSKPAFHKDQSYQNSRGSGGWPNEEYLWMSTAYSFYCARRHHPNVGLITDSLGYEVLIKKLQVPYDEAKMDLDALESEDHRLWVLGKVKALKMQSKPFIHVENDVFLWQALPASSNPDYLIAQSRIQYPDKYKAALKEVIDYFGYIPEALYKRGVPDYFSVLNIGIIGGNDIEFFHNYCSQVEQFVYRNKEAISGINVGLFCNLADEYLFSCLVEERGKGIDLYIDVPPKEVFDTIVRFNLVPFWDKYIHLVGTAKQNRHACEQMALRFRYEFPQEYKRISRVLQHLCPPQPHLNEAAREAQWERALKAFSVIYATDVDGLLNKKVQLPEHVRIRTRADEQGEVAYEIEVYDKYTSLSEGWQLRERDEALAYFDGPVSINELLEGLRAEGFIYDAESLAQYRFKLLDFVTEKITIDGILEFA